jgi:amino-acid N-acetyltransferase
MDEQKLKEQVELIRQVFEYVQLFRGRTFVFKIDGAVMNHSYLPVLVKDLVLLHRQGIRIVLVPGAKERIDEILERYHLRSETVAGVRISTAEAMPFIKMAAFDVSNRLMTLLAEANAHAIIGNWVRARSLGVLKGVDYQYTGTVERVNLELLRKILGDGLIPIFPNIGWNVLGKPYNISSDELACALGTALNAEKLFFVSTCPGVSAARYALPAEVQLSGNGGHGGEGVATHLTVPQARTLIELNKGRSDDELLKLLSIACRACSEGVARVHIVDGALEGVILKEIFSSRGSGTMIYTNQHENIRPMRAADIPEVLRIMQPFVVKEILVPRDKETLEEQREDFVVYEVDGIIHACGALHPSAALLDRAEIAAVAVDETYVGMGIGKRIVSFLISRARQSGLKQVFVLTTQTADWFLQFGFREGGVEDLPPGKRKYYNRSRNSRVLVLDPAEARLCLP